jgi:hypothetical protein
MEIYTIEPITQPDELGPEELAALMWEMKTLIASFEAAFEGKAGPIPIIDLDE